MSSKKSMYGLNEASRQWYLMFDETIRNFGFKENEEDNCIYRKFRNEKFIFLILYVDDILLANSDVSLLLETKIFLSSNFDMKNLGEASFILGIKIHRDRRNGVLGLSKKMYFEKLSGHYLGLICDESLTCHDLNLNLGHFDCFTFNFVSCWRIAFACLMV
jgi:hypothetical protein